MHLYTTLLSVLQLRVITLVYLAENARIAQLKIEAGFALLKQRDAPTAASKDKEPRVVCSLCLVLNVVHRGYCVFIVMVSSQFSFVTETADDDNASGTVEAVPLKQQLRLADYAVKASAARLSVSHDAAFDAWWNALVIPFKVRSTIIHVRPFCVVWYSRSDLLLYLCAQKLARAQVSRGVGKTTYNVQRFVNVCYEVLLLMLFTRGLSSDVCPLSSSSVQTSCGLTPRELSEESGLVDEHRCGGGIPIAIRWLD
jgi:hypothetical protein